MTARRNLSNSDSDSALSFCGRAGARANYAMLVADDHDSIRRRRADCLTASTDARKQPVLASEEAGMHLQDDIECNHACEGRESRLARVADGMITEARRYCNTLASFTSEKK